MPREETPASIAEHLQAAGELHAAYGWHMRAGTWGVTQHQRRGGELAAGTTGGRREYSADDPDRLSMRIAPRALLCATAFRVGGGGTETGFDESRDLCRCCWWSAGRWRSAWWGSATAKFMNADRREASRLATELVRLLESIEGSDLCPWGQ